MFYAFLALLIFEPFSSSKHSGVLSYFNRVFIKGGVFPDELGRVLNKAFETRMRGDYREYFELSRSDVEMMLPKAREFVRLVRQRVDGIAPGPDSTK